MHVAYKLICLGWILSIAKKRFHIYYSCWWQSFLTGKFWKLKKLVGCGGNSNLNFNETYYLWEAWKLPIITSSLEDFSLKKKDKYGCLPCDLVNSWGVLVVWQFQFSVTCLSSQNKITQLWERSLNFQEGIRYTSFCQIRGRLDVPIVVLTLSLFERICSPYNSWFFFLLKSLRMRGG